jgi:hypothetical protein
MKKILIAIAAVAALFLAMSGLKAQGAEPPSSAAAPSAGGAASFAEDRTSIYGYAVSYASVDFRELPSEKTELGGIAYVRMKGDFKPQEGLSFHVEASYDARTGYQSPFAPLADSGLLDPAAPGVHTFVSSISVDQAYGSVVAGAFSLQAGKLPIGWGSAYVFNPTQRASRPALLDPVADETPGTLAVLPTWSPIDAFRLSAYAAFQDKSHRETVAAEDGAIENLPFGIKAQTTIGSFDLSASFIKEVDYVENPLLGSGDYRRALFAGLDLAGAIWDFGVYAEAALRLPAGDDGLSWEPGDFDFLGALEVAAGFDYSISGLELELRGEYYHQGSGTSDKTRYSALDLMSGARLLQAEDYLFARAEKTFADYFKLSAGGLANLNDGSFVGMAELLYDAMENLELKLGGVLPWGPSGSEFEGRYDLGALGLGEIDVMRSSIYASCKVSF